MSNKTEDEHQQQRRAALQTGRMCKLPNGKKLLARAWWRDADFAEGSLLRNREECRQRRERVARKRKHGTWDDARQREARTLAQWRWQFAPEELWAPSAASH